MEEIFVRRAQHKHTKEAVNIADICDTEAVVSVFDARAQHMP
jgi:hypothetical protein